MSDVEKYWDAIRAKWPTPQPSWHELDPQKQIMIIQSLNMLIAVMQ
jgi:hypothetical protein